jgi:hypothetical protein
MIVVKELTKTCSFCPSQWEGRTEDDKPIYVRYRWGHLSICLGQKGGSINDAVLGESVFESQLGDSLDGYLYDEELINATKGIIQWPSNFNEEY